MIPPTHSFSRIQLGLRLHLVLCLLLGLSPLSSALQGIGALDPSYLSALERAEANRVQLELAVAIVPEAEQGAMRWLIANMPTGDLLSLNAVYLATNHRIAFDSWNLAPWKAQVSEDVFLDAVLPYASVNEARESWREVLRARCLPLVVGAQTASEAAAMLNNSIWKEFNVKYSTKREKPDQSSFETMKSGLASCTGLSVLLIDACRSVGVPARFVGTALWSDDSGNHSWVEIWDDGWHFTGAAEPTGSKLDEGWFTARASGARRDEEKYAIYAVSWRDTPIAFPMVWRPADRTVDAVNVTDRYTAVAASLPEGKVRVRFCAMDSSKQERVEALVQVEAIPSGAAPGAERAANSKLAEGGPTTVGKTRDERFDSNDHLVAQLDEGQTYRGVFHWQGHSAAVEFVASDQLLVQTEGVTEERKPAIGLSRLQAQLEQQRVWSDYKKSESQAANERIAAGVLQQGDLRLRFSFTTFGDEPVGGHSLFISMHGGGNTEAAVNDRQWENQKKLYSLTEGIYLAPRAPTNTWNLWHEAHIDGFLDQLIRDLVLSHGINSDRVYLTGYSAGGDGVYQLAPRMADRFAAAGMMAGHPNETRPDGLRNLPFALHVGAEDAAYDRNKIAGEWKAKLAELAANDPGAYLNQCEVHAGKGHWMDRGEAPALEWMASHTRDLRPTRLVWLQDDVVHNRFYWLRNREPKARERIVVEREGQVFNVIEAPPNTPLELLLDDSICDLDQEISVRQGKTELFRGRVPRGAEALMATLSERGDPRGMFSAMLPVVTLPE